MIDGSTFELRLRGLLYRETIRLDSLLMRGSSCTLEILECFFVALLKRFYSSFSLITFVLSGLLDPES